MIDLIVKNRYQAIKIIGKGGFGKTFLAIDTHSQNKTRCVIKQLLHSDKTIKSKNWQLFITEINRLKSLESQENIPKLIDFCQEDNSYYLIQEFIDGENLQLELNKQGNFSQLKIITLLKQLLPIIKFIHEKKIIHRDIKPANIIRKIDNQQLYLVDFGAAKLLASEDAYQTATIVGSPEYIAPEQARGKTIFASDIYSLGVTCLTLLTGRSPFDLINLDNQWIWQEYLTEKIDKKLIKILNKMVDFSLNKRYLKVEEIIIDLNKKEEKKIISWQNALGITSILGIVGLINIFQENKVNFRKKTLPISHSKIREKEALEALILLTDIQESYYQKNGEFLETMPTLPFAKGHIFKIEKLSPHHIAIIALATENDVKNFVTMIWGGNPDTLENRQKQENYQVKNNDWGVLANANIEKNPSKLTVRFNYCETETPIKKYPKFAGLKVTESIPLSYDELPCPEGYTYSLSMIELMSQKATQTTPMIIYDNENK